jgi:hypothetical protein
MPLHPETCAHCSTVVIMTRQVMEAKTPPPDAIRSALLLGIVVGRQAAIEDASLPMCGECETAIGELHEQFFGEPPDGEGAEPEPAEPQEPAPQT